jgi:hypothetical protein
MFGLPLVHSGEKLASPECFGLAHAKAERKKTVHE